MAWGTFNTLAAGNQSLSLFDTQFANVAQWGIVDCTAGGTNAITLTASLANYIPPAVANFVSYRFVAAATTTGAVTLKISTGSFLNAYKADGVTQLNQGDIVANQLYMATFNQALNTNTGGWYITPIGLLSLTIPQNSQSAAYTTKFSDGGGHILHPASDNNPRTFTIDSNANVPYAIGTPITFVNKINTVSIAITADTLTLAGTGGTGTRTLAANGLATAMKIATTEWMISGSGLT